jgi:hypothetical protein
MVDNYKMQRDGVRQAGACGGTLAHTRFLWFFLCRSDKERTKQESERKDQAEE